MAQSGGRVVKRTGDVADAGRVVAAPTPGPPTALSRAAQRDPATANRVWITPTSGGSRAVFRVHFRTLLNGADYYYTVSGGSHSAGSGCALMPPGDEAGAPDVVRGDVWNSVVPSYLPAARTCPGTYRLSVGVLDLGIFGSLRRPARPFGSATFTVR
ncbi:MAG: hypothetical protein ACLP01_14545 [Solirubrobacteraceae bacterium]